jgi:serine/threonine protein kinase
MYNCSISPTLDTSYDTKLCSSIIKSLYEYVDMLSNVGTVGLVLTVRNTEQDKDYALKISEYNADSINEIIIGCNLSSLSPSYTDIFITPIDWARCDQNVYGDDLLNQGHDDDIHDRMDGDSMYLFMPKIDFTFATVLKYKRKYEFSNIEVISFIFELLHGTLIAQKQLNFCHNDIKPDNIGFIEYDDNIIRHYTVNNVQYKTESKYYPVLIDFSASTMGIQCTQPDAYKIISSLNLYNKNKYNDLYTFIQQLYQQAISPNFDLYDFLSNPLFNSLKSDSNDDEGITFQEI